MLRMYEEIRHSGQCCFVPHSVSHNGSLCQSSLSTCSRNGNYFLLFLQCGSGNISYKSSLTAVFLEGCMFLIISALSFRAKIAKMIPRPIRLSSVAGIRLLLAFIGLQSNQGIGVVGFNPSTLLAISACPSQYKSQVAHVRTVNGTLVLILGAISSGEILCTSHRMQNPMLWLGIVGFVIISYCLMKEIKGAMIYGILFVTFVSWIRGTQVTYFPYTLTGHESFEYFKKIADVHKIESTAVAYSFAGFRKTKLWVALVTVGISEYS